MLTIPAEFALKAAHGDTRKIFVAHLYYSDTDYLRVATFPTEIDGSQYYGILKNVSGASQKWNIETNNTVTVSTPTLKLVPYLTDSGYDIMSLFNIETFIGRKMVIYIGFENQLLANMLQLYEGEIDEITFSDNNIDVIGKTYEFPNIQINGSQISYDENKIISSTTASYTAKDDIIQAADKKYLPVLFGRHWNAPALQYARRANEVIRLITGETTYIEYPARAESYFAFNDILYSGMCHRDASNLYRYNDASYVQSYSGQTAFSVLIEDDGYYIPLIQEPLNSTIFWNVRTRNWPIQTTDYFRPQTFYTFNYTNNDTTDIWAETYYAAIPLKFTVSGSYEDVGVGSTLTGDIEDLFTANYYTVGLTGSVIPEHPITASINVDIDIKQNLRGDENGVVRPNRKISVPSTGLSTMLGYWWTNYYVGINVNEYNVSGHFNINGFIPNVTEAIDTVFQLTHSDHISSVAMGAAYESQVPPTTTYNYHMRSFGYNNDRFTSDTDYLTDFSDNTTRWKFGDTLDDWWDNPREIQADYIYLPREGLEKNAKGRINLRMKSDGGTKTWLFNKFFMACVGEVTLDNSSLLYVHEDGMRAAKDSDAYSYDTSTDDGHFLNRPYEYIEFILRAKASASDSDFSDTFKNINTEWEEFFSTNRDNSGFSIDWNNTVLLKDFINSYISYEPYTVFRDSDGIYHIKILKKKYSETDVDGVLDYNDSTAFDIKMTPSNLLYAQAKVSTDWQYGLEEYVNNINWKLTASQYDYGYWRSGNSYQDNQFISPDIEKKYTSYVTADSMITKSVGYGCAITNRSEPAWFNSIYWRPLTEGTISSSLSEWNANTLYYGDDRENYVIAKWYLNQWANRHRIIHFETDDLTYLKFTVGDIVEVENCPKSLLGIYLKGFGGSGAWETTINDQTIYACFIITNIQKSLDKVTIEAMQLHDLTAYEVERI